MRKIQVEKTKVSEIVSRHLEEEIIKGALPTGSYLPPERELMDIFGVGRPAVREAIFMLQNKGLIATRNGMRAMIVEPKVEVIMEDISGVVRHMLLTSEGQKNLYEARVFLEVGLIRDAVTKATSEDIDKLGLALERNKDAIGDLKEFLRTDMDFHCVLAEVPRNPIFPSVRQAIYGWLHEQSERTLLKPGQQNVAYEFHKQIFEKLQDRDADGAEKAMREHMEQSYALYRSNNNSEKGKEKNEN
jgi:GntR family transcriptional regulator, sialic acid-inducible nan operon repressor